MNRNDFFKKLISGLIALPFLAKIVKSKENYSMWNLYGGALQYPYLKKFKVETFEHVGWGFKTDFKSDREKSRGESKYVTQWVFDSKEEAVEFVRSLQPRLRSLVLIKDDQIDSMRSGYRGAIRVQVRSQIHSMEVEIVSKQSDGSSKLVLEDHWPWWSIGTAWGYLACIRINGEPVSRPSPSGSLSQYLVEPFIKDSTCEIVEYGSVKEYQEHLNDRS